MSVENLPLVVLSAAESKDIIPTTPTPVGWPQFDEKAIKVVGQVLRSGKVNY